MCRVWRISTRVWTPGFKPPITAGPTAVWTTPPRFSAGSATSSGSVNCPPPPMSAVCFSIAWTASSAAIPRSCFRNVSMKLLPIWLATKSKSASIRWIPPKPMSTSTASCTALPVWWTRSPTDFGFPLKPNPLLRPNPRASTMSNCSIKNGRITMFEPFFGFKKTPFAFSPDPKQLFESGAWTQLKSRLQFLTDHRGAGLLTGEAGSGKSTAARTWLARLNPNLYKTIYLHWSSGSALDLLRQLARDLDLEPAHFKGDLVDQIAEAILRLNKTKKQHPILVFDEAQLLSHPALEQLPLLLNFEMDSCHYLTLLLIGQPLLRRTLSLQFHEALRQRIAVHYHLEGLSRSA